ncbi:peroxisomal targeting signal 1 receptor-like [Babylonia areolata]|uniref:peroxisomal targeting signal 1 receptor-like n=1 Tax=Babylonia areolata TaxID=304850 RepID=UPI003FD3B01B
MARNLVDGECGGANSLMKLTSHFTQDKAFRQEAIGPGARPPHHEQVGRPIDVAHPDELVGEFLSGQSMAMAPQTFHMASLLQEMRELEEAEIAQAPQRGPAVVELAADEGWADEFIAAEHSVPKDAEWAAEFDAARPVVAPSEVKWAAEYLDQAEQPEHVWAAEFDKRILTDPSWVEEFKTSEEEGKELAATARDMLETVNDPKMMESEFMKFVKKIGDGEITIQDNKVVEKSPDERAEDWVSDFRTAEGAKTLTERWAEEFSGLSGAESDAALWDKLQEHWEDADSQNHGHPWLTEFEQTDPYEKYKFEEDNPLKDHPSAFDEGLKLLEKGDIPNAVLLFEAAVQQNPDNMLAWQYLGTTQAENEQEPHAIAALKKCLELSPDNLKAWQSLAVSYTNESLGSQACHALRSWLRHNPAYSKLLPAVDKEKPVTSSFMTSAEYEEVRDLFLSAVQSALPENPIDADVQSNLGVLFNLSGEYSKAVDCFQAALQARPQDALLWNKLGATLANGGRSEEAVDAYHHALQMSPGFIRARYNLGIACINLGAHKEAIEHFLTALNIQQKSRGSATVQSVSQMSNNIWSTLRMCLFLMSRKDLVPLCENNDIDALCSEFGVSS